LRLQEKFVEMCPAKSRRRAGTVIAVLLTAFEAGVLADGDDFPPLYEPRAVKIICFGWDNPDTRELRKNIREMEQTVPGNGVGVELRIEVTENGKKMTLGSSSFLRPEHPVWKKEWLSPVIDDLKAAKSDILTDNFIKTTTYPGNIDWLSFLALPRAILRSACQRSRRGLCFRP